MVSKHFKLQELVSKEMYQDRGTKGWQLINPALIILIDRIKRQFPNGTMTINNWMWGGNRSQSGLRSPGSKWYSPTSQHSLGNAADCVFSDYSTDEVRDYLIANAYRFPELKGVEKGVNWLHVDVRNSEAFMTFNA